MIKMVELVIKSASTAKTETAIVKYGKDLKKLQLALDTPKRIENLVKGIWKQIEKDIERGISNGFSTCMSTFYLEDLRKMHYEDSNEVDEAIKIITDCLIASGYQVHTFHEYSLSWQNRSGKYGYLSIYWDK